MHVPVHGNTPLQQWLLLPLVCPMPLLLPHWEFIATEFLQLDESISIEEGAFNTASIYLLLASAEP